MCVCVYACVCVCVYSMIIDKYIYMRAKKQGLIDRFVDRIYR